MNSNFRGSAPLTAYGSNASGSSAGTVTSTGLSLSPLQSYDSLKDGLEQVEHDESTAQLAVRRYSDSLRQYTSVAFDNLKADLRERKVDFPAAPKGFTPVAQAAGLV